jgi:S-adenosylmethionine:tRNA ribosyltransferase-isomerase
MQNPQDIRIEEYNYDLPAERIAKYPLSKRDASKLLIYKEGIIAEDAYRNISAHIPSDSLLVFNQTKVIHARLLFRKPSGAVIEVFCLEPHEQYPDVQAAMAQKGTVWWKCMIGGVSKWKRGLVLEETFTDPDFRLSATIVERAAGSFTLELSWDNDTLSFGEVLQTAGKVPLPPYLHREVETIDEERYQTVYAKDEGSVAAPTAGLHFTNEVMESLSDKGITADYLSLHVGAGTFKPVKTATIREHEMHAEWIDVSVDSISTLLNHLEKRVIAVGTTSLRTIESLYWIGAKILLHSVPDFSDVSVTQWQPYELGTENISAAHALTTVKDWLLQNHLERLVTRTQILIAPGYKFRIADGLITNFHQPQSTLLLLVSAFIGDDWHKVYDYALQNDYRFLSYGDGSLLWRTNTNFKD